jgi:hypothetical protein
MPKKKSERQPWEVIFTSIPISREQVATALSYDKDFSRTERILVDALVSSAKLSVSYNATTGSFMCSCTIGDRETGLNKRCFTSHAPDMLDAMRITAYKIGVILDGDVYAVHDANVAAEQYG